MQQDTISFKKVADTPLEFSELKRMLGQDLTHCNFFHYDDLNNMAYEEFSNKPSCIVIIFQKNDIHDPVGHFFTILFKDHEIEYFDPYGFNIKKLYHITQQPNSLSRLLTQSNKKIIQNTTKYQQLRDDIETCGRWCVSRIKMYKYSNKQFHKFMKQPINTLDQKVTILTYFL